MKENENALVMLAKKPVIGRVKTRIAEDTSESFALKLALTSIEDSRSNLTDDHHYDFVVATDSPEELKWFEERHNLSGIIIKPSEDKNLSYKMDFVFNTLLNDCGYEKAALIPMDVPFVTSKEVIYALSRLDDHKYVLGPEPNGGVYLIGMTSRSLNAKLFHNVAWSTPRSFETLINNFTPENTYILDPKDDFNTFQDLLNNKEIIKLMCPNLYHLLQSESY